DIPPKDAVAALRATSGDAESAMAHALQVSGPAEQGNPENAAKLDVWAKMAEAQRVLERFSKSGTRRHTVKRIERVQNPRLWRRFALRRKELRDEHGHEGDNESLLFHGADKSTLEAVINEGFDIRVANVGSLGLGTYFAQDSTYSAAYSCEPRRAALNQLEVQQMEEHRAVGQTRRPAFLSDGQAMLLCRVALGNVAQGSSNLRRAPAGSDSVCRAMDNQQNDIFAVFDNSQSYPEYIVHYQCSLWDQQSEPKWLVLGKGEVLQANSCQMARTASYRATVVGFYMGSVNTPPPDSFTLDTLRELKGQAEVQKFLEENPAYLQWMFPLNNTGCHASQAPSWYPSDCAIFGQADTAGKMSHSFKHSMPAHWKKQTCDKSVQLVPLALPGAKGKLPTSVDPQAFMEAVWKDMPPESAMAACLASGEAQHVLDCFTNSGLKLQQVKHIERVQNPMLWRRFAFWQQEQKHTTEGKEQEKEAALLFHGADKQTLEAIINEGFDVRVCNAGQLGQGTYFAKASAYSATYSRASQRAKLNAKEVEHLQLLSQRGQTGRPAFLPNGHAMLLCRVALGKVTEGSQELRRPPPGFDSVSNAAQKARDQIYAVFDNNQSYPEYIVHFQQEHQQLTGESSCSWIQTKLPTSSA
ncbi:hypothetical protein WJX84_000851, partial [Apatococcus fuscideae]